MTGVLDRAAVRIVKAADRSSWAVRLSRPTVMAFGLAFTITNIAMVVTGPDFAWDVDAYWNAAMRLREGQPLYVPFADVGAPEVFRYAPWFAWLWIPLTNLPRGAVDVAWCVAMLICSCMAVWPMLRSRTEAGLAMTLLTWPMLVYVSVGGNIHAAMVAALVYGLQTRWGPLAIAAAASLKAVPLALALVYLGRRDWVRFGVTIVLTIILVVPMLFYGIDDYTTDTGPETLLTGWTWFIGVGAACAATVALARTRYAWLAGSLTVAMAFPRWLVYDVSLLLAGYPQPHGPYSHSGGGRKPAGQSDRWTGGSATQGG